MRIANNWVDYELSDVSGGERLERWGQHTLIRPDPTVMWGEAIRAAASAKYVRSDKGGGEWSCQTNLPESWKISYQKLGLTFKVKPTGFKHTGLFPEQAANWDFYDEIIRGETARTGRRISVLNLFAYTGGATLACLNAGASVCHLDAVKNMVEWAKENARLSDLADKPVRWIIDDAAKFLAREIKRGNRYDAVILDPPSYGRGTNGETWKIEDCINNLLLMCAQVLSEQPLFLLMNSYTTGLSPSAVRYLMQMTVGRSHRIRTEASEIGLPVTSTGLALPCGNTAIVLFKE
jgi:23S rRNA (cytosine1962-C5)-methyltransferase